MLAHVACGTSLLVLAGDTLTRNREHSSLPCLNIVRVAIDTHLRGVGFSATVGFAQVSRFLSPILARLTERGDLIVVNCSFERWGHKKLAEHWCNKGGKDQRGSI